MLFAPIMDEDDRLNSSNDYSHAMSDWFEFTEGTQGTYGVDMRCLEENYEKEQKE
jgi:hypothetical protein